jgi:hypothetical protein
MIKLYQFNPVWGLPNASPFCMKLETYSFLANILVPPLKSPLKDHGMFLPNLWAYCERMKAAVLMKAQYYGG